jgi:predicted ribosome-associated RNA-binding protein Tma20
LTRSTDFDQPAEIPGAFTFVEAGSTNYDTGWVCTTDAPVTVGTTNIIFTQFSGAGQYTANTSAGLLLTGTVFSAKIDDNTTAFDGSGNIIVKAGANLTTPNIGAATGTSLSVTGNITGANLNAAGLSLSSNVVSALNVSGEIAGSNITTPGLISAAGNIAGGNVNTGIVSASGNVVAANLNAAGLSLSSNVISALNVTGAIAGANLTTPGLVSAAGNITGGNVNTGIVSASGNVVAANLNAAGLSLSSNVVSSLNVTGEIAGANVTTPGLISATGNITGANATLTAGTVSTTTATGALVVTGGLGVGGNIYATAVYDNSVRVLTENSTVDGGTY